MYVLRLLQHQASDKLHIVAYFLTVSRIYYALYAWGDLTASWLLI